MGLAVPSVAEASRGLPSVKPFVPPADDEIVTSVAFSASAVPDDVSPELALVDPALADRLRAHLPEPADALAPRPVRTPAADPEPGAELAVPTAPRPEPLDAAATPATMPAPLDEPTGESRPDPEAHGDPPIPVTVPAPVASNVRPLRPMPVVETSVPATIDPVPSTDALVLQPQPQPEIEIEPRRAPRVVVAPAEPVVRQAFVVDAGEDEPALPATRPFVASPRWDGTATRRLLVAFAAGAVVASVVVVGVIAELGESGGEPAAVSEESSPALAPPIAVAPAPQPSAPSASTGAAKKPPAAASKQSSAAAKKKSAAAAKKSSAAATKKSPAAAKKSSAAANKTSTNAAKKKAAAAKTSGATATAPARRFAWAPVDGAVGYRVELFRGDQQVLRTTTKQPAYELPGSWRHQGRTERLSPGSYRWYVWPVLAGGPSAEAVVQARLDVP